MDWQGLLKWSLTQHDGTVKKDIKEMDEDRKKWLMEALAEHALQDVKRMQEILEIVGKPDLETQEDEDNKVTLLEELEDIVDNLDMADSLYQIGGLVQLIKQAINSPYDRVKHISFSVFITCNQNSPHVQHWSIEEGAFKFVNIVLNAKNVKTREWALAALSSLVRGENLEAKRNFLSIDGLEFLLKVLTIEDSSIKMKGKALSMIRDLVYYDERLHFTYNNLEAFANTNAKVVNGKQSQLIKPNNSESNNDITYDQNKEMLKENEKPENAHFQNSVKKALIGADFVNTYMPLLSGIANNQIDMRLSFLTVLEHLLKYSQELRLTVKEKYTPQLKNAMLAFMKNSAANENINAEEISHIKDVLVTLEKN